MKKLLLKSMVVLLLTASHAYAQTQTITGTVTEKDGRPLPGVSVVVKGTKTGTQTSGLGKFSIKAGTEKPVLVFTFIVNYTKNIEDKSDEMNVI